MMQSRWLAPVGVLVVALVVLASAAGDVGVGASGKPLAMAVWLVVYAAAGLVFLLDARNAARWQVIALLAVLGAAAVALHAADPAGPVVGLFLVPAFAPLRLPLRTAIAVSAASALAFNVVQLLENDSPVVFALVTDGGAAFFFLFGWLLRREAEQRTWLDTALTELEARRDAEAVAAALAERGRIAREMHDVLAHTLSGLSLQLGGVGLLARGTQTDPELRVGIDRAHTLAKEGLAEARRAIAALRGDALPGPDQLPGLVDEHRHSGGTAALHVIGDPMPVGAEQKLAIYRTAQEGLSNIRKHAPNTAVAITLRWGDDDVVVEVCNDVPADLAVPVEPGYGLTGLAERAHLLGGTFTAGPEGGQFHVAMRLPVNGTRR